MCFFTKTHSCFRFVRDYRKIFPRATAVLHLGISFIHVYCLDIMQGEVYTIEWTVKHRTVPFLWIIAPFLQGSVKVSYGDKYRHKKGLKIYF